MVIISHNELTFDLLMFKVDISLNIELKKKILTECHVVSCCELRRGPTYHKMFSNADI